MPSLTLILVCLISIMSCSQQMDYGQKSPVVSYISLGTETDQFPAAIAILSRGQNICSGTLISEKVVITAAHCLKGTYPDQVFVGNDISVNDGDYYEIDTSFHNLNFENKKNSKYDYGFIKLKTSVVGISSFPIFSANSNLQCLLEKCDDSLIQLVGFGFTKEEEEMLLEGHYIHSYNKKKNVVNYPATFTLSAAFELVTPPLLAGGRSGDSGGGLLLSVNGETHLIGIVSRGIPHYNAEGEYTPQNVFSLASNARKWYISQLAVIEAESFYQNGDREMAYKIINNDLKQFQDNGNAVVAKAMFLNSDYRLEESRSFLERYRRINDYAELLYIDTYFKEGAYGRYISLFRQFLLERKPHIGAIKYANYLFKTDNEICRMIFEYLTTL